MDEQRGTTYGGSYSGSREESTVAAPTEGKMELERLTITATLSCDKGCSMCSKRAGPGRESLPYSTFVSLIGRLAALGVCGINLGSLGFTGGEPTMYESQGRRLADLVSYGQRLRPGRIDIQTAGYGSQVVDFKEQLLACRRAAGNIPLSVATSYTLFQRPGINERMTKTLDTVLDVVEQETLYVYLTSIPENRKDTIRAFGSMCIEAGLALTDLNLARGIIGFEKDSKRVIGMLGATARTGRAKGLHDAAFHTPQAGQPLTICSWLLSQRPTMNVHPNGDVRVCCDPGSEGRTSSIINVFKDDVTEFFRRYPIAKQKICTEIRQHLTGSSIRSGCDICNAVNL